MANIYDEYIASANPQKIISYFNNENNISEDVVNFAEQDYYNSGMRARIKVPNLTNYSRNIYNLIKKIVDFRSQFLFAKGFDFENKTPEKTDDFSKFLNSWENSKLNSHYVKLATSLFAYGKSAEIITIDDENQVKHIPLISGKNGQEFYAFFDNNQNLAAFSRYYKIKELLNSEIKDVDICEIYTNEFHYIFKKYNRQWEEIDVLQIDKMPIVYYEMPKPISFLIKNLQDNYNEILNELSDVNSQVAYPFMIFMGDVLQTAYSSGDLIDKPFGERQKAVMDKLNSGMMKAVSLEGDSDFKIMNWDSEPKTLMFEIQNTKKMMYSLTSVPDLSLESIKDLGLSNISGLALQTLFLDSEISKQGDFNLFFEMKRAINLHLHALGINDINITATTKSYLPKDMQEIISNLVMSVNSGLLSKKTAISNNPLVTNIEEEIENINEDNQQSLNQAMNDVTMGEPFI